MLSFCFVFLVLQFAIAFVHFNKVVFTGKVEEKRSKLRLLLGKDDSFCSTIASSSNPTSPDEPNPDLKFDELYVSDILTRGAKVV